MKYKKIFVKLICIAFSVLLLMQSAVVFAFAADYREQNFKTDIPSFKVVAVNTNSIKVSWSPVVNAEGYIVYRKTSSTQSWSKIATVGEVSSYNDKPAPW
jgi:hypothetical protein